MMNKVKNFKNTNVSMEILENIIKLLRRKLFWLKCKDDNGKHAEKNNAKMDKIKKEIKMIESKMKQIELEDENCNDNILAR